MINLSILVGRIGKDVEHRVLDNGTHLSSFSVATNKKYKDKQTGEKKEITDWHNIVSFGKVAELISQYAKKGDLVHIIGESRARSWEKDGVTRYTTEVVVDKFKILSSKQSNGDNGTTIQQNQKNTSYQAANNSQQGGFDDLQDDDLPF